MPNGFKGRHFPADFILLCVRWYLKFNISYRHLAEMMQERSLAINEQRRTVLLCQGGDGNVFTMQNAMMVVEIIHDEHAAGGFALAGSGC